MQAGGGILSDCQWDSESQQYLDGVSAAPVWLRRVFGDDFFATVVLADAKSDRCLEAIKDLPELRELRTISKQITDTGLENIKGLSRLERLRLANAQVSDAGMEHLKGLTQLRYLDWGALQSRMLGWNAWPD